MTVEGVYRLREEARKSWDYFISDEIVYAAELRDGEVPGGQRGYIETYVEHGLWFEVVARGANNEGKFVYIVEAESQSFVSTAKAEVNDSTHGRDNAMLVFISQLPEDAEKFHFRPLSSIVWLKSFDLMMCSGEDKLESAPPALRVPPSRRGGTEWELNAFRIPRKEFVPRLGHMQHGKLPSNMVEGSAEVAENVTDNQAPIAPHVPTDLEPVEDVSLLSLAQTTARVIHFALSAEGDLWAVRGATDSRLKSVDVHIRPRSLALGALEWTHLLYSTHGQGQEDNPSRRRQKDTRFRCQRGKSSSAT